MPKSYISIGGNIDKDLHIPAGLKALERLFGKLFVSSVYESEPVGFSGDPFYNLVVGFDTDFSIMEIIKHLRQIESANGRIRNGQKFSGHTLDLDLILYGNQIVDNDDVQIPRKDIENYAFVLEPLAEIAPGLEHPVRSISFEKLWNKFNKTGINQKRVRPPWLSKFSDSRHFIFP
ncbi:MAG: 2-amino-4-hydroxy-6-hydroxymethyldihydropteridine diphosphokinase [Methylomonas sp.]|jgi:2-amino-4-hydroxy-6-hydroxymethyldihydropteridine diphosphokinase